MCKMKQILMISLAFLLFSCRMTRQTTADVQTSAVEQKEVFVQVNESKSDNSVIEIDKNEHVTVIVFSPPDSSGKQYITSITEIQKNKTLSGKQNIVEEKETLTLAESITQTAENVKVVEKSKTETKTPGWLYVVAGILSVGIVVVIIWILRRYKIL